MKSWAEIEDYIHVLGATQVRTTLPLTDDWRFHAGDIAEASQPDFDDSSWRVLSIPHDYSIEHEFAGHHAANGFVRSGVVWYRTPFKCGTKRRPADMGATSEPRRGKTWVVFDGVSMNSEVWINGRYLGLHPYGFTPFWYDITPFVHVDPDRENVLAVRADCSLQPFSRSYTGTGLFRHVWLISTGTLHIEQWGVTAQTVRVESGCAQIAIATGVRVDRYPETEWNAFDWQGRGTEYNNFVEKNCTLITSVCDLNGNTIAETQDTRTIPQFQRELFWQVVDIPCPRYWSPEQPDLYVIRSTVLADGEAVDDAITPLGVRTLDFDARHGFRLNGHPTKLKGVCLHQDSGIYGGAVPVRAWVKKLLQLKGAGCNAIRTSHHPFPAEFYHVCDYLGMMVMDEAFDEWQQGWDRGLIEQAYGKAAYGYYLYFEQWHATDLRAMIRRDRNHPSIVMWSVGNEIPELYFPEGVGVLDRLVRICKEEDTSRPVTVCAEGNHLLYIHEGIMDLVDVAGYNYVNSREGEAMYDRIHSEHPDWILLGSETAYEPLHWKAVRDNPYVIGQFLWVGCDYLGEGADMFGEDSRLGATFDIAALAGSKENSSRHVIRHGWAFGLLDVIGTPRSEYFYRKSVWDQLQHCSRERWLSAGAAATDLQNAGGWRSQQLESAFVHLAVKLEGPGERQTYRYLQALSHWNWAADELKTVYCFTNCEQAELFLNGESLGKKQRAPASPFALEWELGYQPGCLTAHGYVGTESVCEHSLRTAGQAAAIRLQTDSDPIPGRNSLVEILIEVVDESGAPVPDARNRIAVEVSGPAQLLGVLSGDMTSSESYRSSSCAAYRGRCMAVVQAGGSPGAIEVKADSEGLVAGRVAIQA